MKIVKLAREKGHFAGFLIGVGKVVMAILSHSWLIFIHAVYNIIKAGAKHYALKEGKKQCSTMFYSGLLIIAASTVYLVYSIYIYAFGSTASYHMYVAIGIAAVTVYELTVTIYGLRKAKREKEVQKETVQYINLASALVSVSLTQTAILSFTNEGADMSNAYAIGDAIFGFFALCVGLFMLFRSNCLKNR